MMIGKLDSQARAQALETYERVTELPLLALAVAIIPLLVLPLSFDLDATIEEAFFAIDWAIWAVFAVDLGIRTYLVERRRQYLIAHWYDVLIVAVPFLRPLRILRSARALRLLRLTRLASFSARAFTTARSAGSRHGLTYVLLAAVFFISVSASLVFAFERGNGGSIDDFGTAIWWAMATVTTVGYGDTVPVTAEGRGVAIFLMIVGISLFGYLTANIAAFLVERDQEESVITLHHVMNKLDDLEREIKSLRQEQSKE
jgi:voltage-gated potassium channel